MDAKQLFKEHPKLFRFICYRANQYSYKTTTREYLGPVYIIVDHLLPKHKPAKSKLTTFLLHFVPRRVFTEHMRKDSQTTHNFWCKPVKQVEEYTENHTPLTENKESWFTDLVSEIPDFWGFCLSHLDERSQKLIKMRFIEGMTLTACGAVFGVSKERARQLIEQSLKKIEKQIRKRLPLYF